MRGIRDSLRIVARHQPRLTVDVQTASNIVTVRTGGSGSVDYEITAPAWLPIKASGQYLYVGVEGAQNEVSAETVRGDIEVREIRFRDGEVDSRPDHPRGCKGTNLRELGERGDSDHRVERRDHRRGRRTATSC